MRTEVVVVPRDRAREVAGVARIIEQSEEDIRKMITTGVTIKEARGEHGYHILQRQS